MSRANRHVKKQLNAQKSRQQQHQRYNKLGPRAKGGSPMAPKKETPAAEMTIDAEVIDLGKPTSVGLGEQACDTAKNFVDKACEYVNTPTGRKVVIGTAIGCFIGYHLYKKFFVDTPEA